MNSITFATFCVVITISTLFEISLSSVVTKFSSESEIEKLFLKLREKSRNEYEPLNYLKDDEKKKLCKSVFDSNFFKYKNERFADKSDDVIRGLAKSNSKLFELNYVENSPIYTSLEALIKLSDGKVIPKSMFPCLAMFDDSELKEYFVSWGFRRNTFFLYVPHTSEQYDGKEKMENEIEFTQKSNVESKSIQEPATDKKESSEKFGINYEEGAPVLNKNAEYLKLLSERINEVESGDYKKESGTHKEVTLFALVELSPDLKFEVGSILGYLKTQKKIDDAINVDAVEHKLPILKNPICSLNYNEVDRLCALISDMPFYKGKKAKFIDIANAVCIQKDSNLGAVDVIGCNVLENEKMNIYYIARAFGAESHAIVFKYDSSNNLLELESYLTNISVLIQGSFYFD